MSIKWGPGHYPIDQKDMCEQETNIGAQLSMEEFPDSNVNVANMGPTWILSAPGGPHVGPMNFAIRDSHFNPNFIQSCCVMHYIVTP